MEEQFTVTDRRRVGANGSAILFPEGNGHSLIALESALDSRPVDLRTLESVIRDQVRSLETSEILARYQFARQNGLTFNGARDEYEIFGYDRTITTRQYREEYLRGGIAGRIIDAMPNATWRGNFEIIEDEDPKGYTEFEQAWLDQDARLQIQAKLLRVDKLAGLSTYAVLLIGAPGDLDTELPKARKPEDLLYLTPFSGGGGPTYASNVQTRSVADWGDATIQELDVDPQSARFGLPKYYRLTRTDLSSGLAKPVHWTRVLHVAENLLDDDVYGLPTLERVWNLLSDLRKVTGGGAEAFWLRANQGLHLDIDKDMALPAVKDTIEALKEQSELYKHQLTRWLRTKGVKAEVLGSDVANFNSPAEAILTQIAGAKAIPKRILMGSEMGELASTQDRDNWKDQINGRQSGYAGPYIVRPLIDRLIKYGYLPIPQKGEREYEIHWPHIETLTEKEKVDGAKGWAGVNQAYGDVVYTDAEIRDKWSGMGPLTEEQRKEIADRTAEKLKQQQEAMAAAQPQPAPAKQDSEEPLARAASSGDDELALVLRDAILAKNADVVNQIIGLGGPGSGNQGHAGRPGQVGGSADSSWSNPSHMLASKISGNTPETPVKTITAYHVTRRENVEQILEKGFDLTKVKPRWTNDYAVSLSRGESAARDYFSKSDPQTGKPVGMNTEKYALLEVKVKGRFFKGQQFEMADVGYATSPRDWTHRFIQTGHDGQDLGATIFVNNPKAILSIREVSAKKRELGGPGSGNYGHAGRPGEVGGSSAGTSPLAGIAQKLGLKTASWDLLPRDEHKVSEHTIVFREPKSAPKPGVLEGIEQGLNDVRNIDPKLFDERTKDNLTLVWADFGDPTVLAATSTSQDGNYIVLNSESVSHDVSDSRTVATVLARGLTGEARNKSIARSTIVHEMGHVIDASGNASMLAGILTAAEYAADEERFQKEFREFSHYAGSGPKELFAEAFTAKLLGAPYPKYLDAFVGDL